MYTAIARQFDTQGEPSIARMCALLEVSRAAFYRYWVQQEPTPAEMELRNTIQRLCLQYPSYGSRRIAPLVQAGGQMASRDVVRRIMHEDNLLAVRQRKFIRTTHSQHRYRIYPNLAQHMELEMADQLWVADLTYIRLQAEFVYLALLLDAWSRRVIAWQLGRTLKTELPLAALNKAIEARQPKPGLVHHSDQGSQYASDEYVRCLQSIPAVLSMSAPGCPWENARCESFIKTLKQEEIYARPYRNLAHLERHLEEFIENFYNPLRLHSALGYRSPAVFEAQAPVRVWRPAPLVFDLGQEEFPDDGRKAGA